MCLLVNQVSQFSEISSPSENDKPQMFSSGAYLFRLVPEGEYVCYTVNPSSVWKLDSGLTQCFLAVGFFLQCAFK